MEPLIAFNEKLPNGQTVKEQNLLVKHAIPLGALVEVDIERNENHGIRAFVCEHARDCDGTPLYSLSMSNNIADLEELRRTDMEHYLWSTENGFSDDCLKVIRYPNRMKLSDYDVHPGLKVISAIGNPGIVIEVRPMTEFEVRSYKPEVEGDVLVTIRWNDRGLSCFPKSHLEAVTVDPEELVK